MTDLGLGVILTFDCARRERDGAVVFGYFVGLMFRSLLLRFVLPVALASCVVAYFGLPYIERLLAEWFRSDVELRAQLVMHSMDETVSDHTCLACHAWKHFIKIFVDVCIVYS